MFVVILMFAAQDLLSPAATLLVGLVTATLIVRQFIALRRRNEFDVLVALGQVVSGRLAPAGDEDLVNGEHPFYALRHRFAGCEFRAPVGRYEYERSIVDRVHALRALDSATYYADLKYVTRVVNALNTLGEALDNRYVSHHAVLAKRHLALIRDVWIVEPYIVREVALERRGRWGMRVLALGAIAREYNNMNPIHRRDVFFVQEHDRPDKAFGPITRAPKINGFRCAMPSSWWLRRTAFGYPNITERRKRSQNAMMERLRRALDDVQLVAPATGPGDAGGPELPAGPEARPLRDRDLSFRRSPDEIMRSGEDSTT